MKTPIARWQRFVIKSLANLEQWLLAHEAKQTDPLILSGAIPSPARRALEYDAYMRNNRSEGNLPLECTLETAGRRAPSER